MYVCQQPSTYNNNKYYGTHGSQFAYLWVVRPRPLILIAKRFFFHLFAVASFTNSTCISQISASSFCAKKYNCSAMVACAITSKWNRRQLFSGNKRFFYWCYKFWLALGHFLLSWPKSVAVGGFNRIAYWFIVFWPPTPRNSVDALLHIYI